MAKRKITVVDDSPYFEENGRLMKRQYNADGELTEPQNVGRYSRIFEKVRNIETGQVIVVVEFPYGGEVARFETSRGNLLRSKIGVLAEQGIDVSDRSALDVLDNLRHTEEKASLRLVHTHAGYSQMDEKLVYKHARIKGSESRYAGKLRLGPSGQEKEFRRLLKDHVFGHAPLELALAIGLSAPLSSLLSRVVNSNVVLVHFFGNSTTGKTTAARLAVAPFGFPATGQEGLIKTWNATPNALQGILGNTHGLALVIDEISMAASLKKNLVYLLSSGVEKDRLTKESIMHIPKTWSGTFISTGEHSWLGKSTKNVGAQVRLLELCGFAWTESAEHADLLKAGLLENYGYLGPQFAEALLDMQSEELVERWRKAKKVFLEQMEERDDYSDRLSDLVAIILATAELANEILGLDFSVDAIGSLLRTSLVEDQEERDLGQKAYRIFLEGVIKNRANFECGLKSEKGTKFLGKIEVDSGVWKEIVVLPQTLREILTEGGFEETKTILQDWKKRGWLETELQKMTRKRTFNGIRQNAHVIKVLEEFQGEPSKEMILSWTQRHSRCQKEESGLFNE